MIPALRKVMDSEVIEYLTNLPVSEILIGDAMRKIVRPDYLLAEDRDAIVSALTSWDADAYNAKAIRALAVPSTERGGVS